MCSNKPYCEFSQDLQLLLTCCIPGQYKQSCSSIQGIEVVLEDNRIWGLHFLWLISDFSLNKGPARFALDTSIHHIITGLLRIHSQCTGCQPLIIRHAEVSCMDVAQFYSLHIYCIMDQCYGSCLWDDLNLNRFSCGMLIGFQMFSHY